MGKCLIIKGADFSSVAADHITIEDPRVVITVVASPAGGGTTTGTGSYDVGDTVTITATPAEGYAFKQWSDGNTNASRTITVGSSAATYTAEFIKPIELINTINGAYLNGSAEVYGEGNPSFSTYNVKFYKIDDSVDSIRVSCEQSGVIGVNATTVYALYSGVDSNNRGTGLISRVGVDARDATFDNVLDTSVYKYVGTSDRAGIGGATPVVLSVNTGS